MNRRKDLLSRISSAFISNLVSFAVSTIIVLIVPKFIAVEQYGFFQLYLFYTGYIGIANFGWPEGILLKYGGYRYDKLDQCGLKTQFFLYSCLSTLAAVCVIVLASTFGYTDKLQLWMGLGIAILFTAPGHFLQVLLHMTNRTHEYARGVLIEKVVYFAAVIVVLFTGIQNYFWLIAADLCGRFALLVYASYQNRSLLRAKASSVVQELPKIWENISVGIKLMLANLVGLFLIGVIRQSIETHWSVEVFAKVSLTLSISNMLMIFIRAVAVVLFPMLKITAYDRLKNIYGMLRLGTMAVLLGMLVFYFPIRQILVLWLPHYSESIQYVALLFPMCIFECRMSMLVETYMKALRLEKQLLHVNIFCVILSIVLSCVTVFVMNSLELALLSIVLVVAVRCILAEIILLKKMGQNKTKDMLMETVLVIGFMVFNWSIGGIGGCGLYLLLYALYILVYRKDLVTMVRSARKTN